MPPGPLLERARAAAELLRQHDDATVTVVHHIDADGVAAGAIARASLAAAGIANQTMHVRSMDDRHVQQVRDADPEVLWFCDLGSTVYDRFDVPRVICDHHELVRDGAEDFQGHVNPLLDDEPGNHVSGAGAAYLVGHALAGDAVRSLLVPALVGATGDLQDRETGRLEGYNRTFIEEATAAGLAEAAPDLAFYGPEVRPLTQFLAYSDDRPVPGITKDRRATAALLERLGIDTKSGGTERTWSDLDEDERTRIRSALVERRIDCGLPVDDLWREVVRLPHEPAGPTRELQSFGTLLNATARYDRPEVGLAVAGGDRGEAYHVALGLMQDHRRNLASSLDAFARAGIQTREHLQWVDVGDSIRDTVIGIVCGMAMDGLDLRTDLPIVAFAHTPDGRTKVSSRASSWLQARGIDLAAAMRAGAAEVGGQGGGHRGAAGATIPRGAEAAFLEAVEAALAPQNHHGD